MRISFLSKVYIIIMQLLVLYTIIYIIAIITKSRDRKGTLLFCDINYMEAVIK